MTIVMMEIKSRYSGMVGTKLCIKRELAEEFDTARINNFFKVVICYKGKQRNNWRGF